MISPKPLNPYPTFYRYLTCGSQNLSMPSEQERLHEIGVVLIKYGFEDAVKELLPLITRVRVRGLKAEVSEGSPYTRLRLALTELGPTFIKFGHFMCSRPDLLPLDLVKELQQLPDSVDPLPYPAIRAIIEEEIGPVSGHFASIDERPFASGSLSQKHLAELKDGSKVLLKVQRPEVSEVIETDLKILRTIAKNAEKVFSELLIFDFPEVVDDFSQEIESELDFVSEGKNAELLWRNMRSVTGVRVPKVHWRQSAPRVLAVEYVEGASIDEVDKLRAAGFDMRALAKALFGAYERQIFVDGFHHGDPEPANLLVDLEGNVVFLDFGLMGVLRPERRDHFTRMIFAVFDDDVEEVVKLIGEVSAPIPRRQLDVFKDEMYKALISSSDAADTEIPENRDLEEVIAAIRRHRIDLPLQTVLTMNTLISVDDLARKLDPGFKMVPEIKGQIGELFKRRILDAINIRKTGMNLVDSIANSGEIPTNINSALRTISEGPIKFKLDYDNLDRLSAAVDKATFRMLVAVSLIVLATQNVVTIGSPWASIAVYLVAGGLGAYSVYKLLLTSQKKLSE